jgi:hypothetical protein
MGERSFAENPLATFDWAFWLFWMMATTLGWLAGRIFFAELSFLLPGLAIGFFQTLVLKGRIKGTWRWLLASAVGWVIGWLLAFWLTPSGSGNLEAWVAGSLTGLAVGFAEWLVLRRETRWAGWWILLSVVAWSSALAFLPGFLLTPIVAGGITGLALELLLRNRKPASPGQAGGS